MSQSSEVMEKMQNGSQLSIEILIKTKWFEASNVFQRVLFCKQGLRFEAVVRATRPEAESEADGEEDFVCLQLGGPGVSRWQSVVLKLIKQGDGQA